MSNSVHKNNLKTESVALNVKSFKRASRRQSASSKKTTPAKSTSQEKMLGVASRSQSLHTNTLAPDKKQTDEIDSIETTQKRSSKKQRKSTIKKQISKSHSQDGAQSKENTSSAKQKSSRHALRDCMTVHRLRCISFLPDSINSIAFQQVPCTDTDTSSNRSTLAADTKFAVARSSADIEIWNASDNFVLEQVLPGGPKLSVETMAWCQHRFFTAGIHAVITEWDLKTSMIKAQCDSYGGAVWCMRVSNDQSTLAIGCDDGCARLYSLDDNKLELRSSMLKLQGRVLSVAWCPDDTSIAAGDDCGSIRLLSRRGEVTHRMTIQDVSVNEKLHVWGLEFVDTTTLVSTSSDGCVQIWNAKYGTLRCSVQTHSAPVLSLAVDCTSQKIFASGADSSIVCLEPAPGKSGTWTVTGKRREQPRDVRSLAVSPDGNTLLAGGLDTTIALYNASTFSQPRESHRIISSLPQVPTISIASTSPLTRPLILEQSKDSLQLWQLTQAESTADEAPSSQVTEDTQLMLRIQLRSMFHISCSAMSSCGSFIAASALDGVRVFRLEASHGILSAKQVNGAGPLSFARALTFTAESSRLLSLTSTGFLEVFSLSDSTKTAIRPNHTIGIPSTSRMHVTSSSDCQWAATSRSKFIRWYNLDTMQCTGYTAAPATVTAMAFVPQTSNVLVLCANRTVNLYDGEHRRLAYFSQVSGPIVPSAWNAYKGIPLSVSFTPEHPDIALLATHSGLVMLNISPELSESDSGFDQPAKRSKHSGTSQKPCGLSITQYKPLLAAALLDASNMVVIERPWLAIEAKLPSPIQRPKYGVS